MSVQMFAQNNNRSVIVTSNNYAYSFDDAVRITSDGTGQHGALICTNDTASIYGFYDAQYGGEGFLAIPAKYQSTKYVIPSFTIVSGYYTSKSIVAVSPLNTNTIVHIMLKSDIGPITVDNVNYSINSSITIVLNPTDTFQLSHTHDLTGTMITSSAPLFVISGSSCINTYMSEGSGDGNPLMEMVLPTVQLDSLYVVPKLAKYQWSTVRVLSVNATSITFRNKTSVISKSLGPREYIDLRHETISYIQASDNVIVNVYPHLVEKVFFDTFMMTIHGVNQYLAEYNFAVPSMSFDSSISIVVQSNEIAGFILDDHPITFYVFNISHGSDDFSTGSVSISPGAHYIKHLYGAKFGLWIYGSKKYDGYGYPGGIHFRN
ncbi:IgGFc-binding protein-like [Mytilus edulis]|uniref:IgGFc-binding protein-like n=1 Tax=Mytilus edulis TaxID=6550 RepID=UPI0039EE46B5